MQSNSRVRVAESQPVIMRRIESPEIDLGYTFKNQKLLNQALSHRSAGPPSNERLEYLGDSILGFVVAEYLYRKFPHLAEGDLTKMRARLVRQNTLAGLARKLNLQNHLHLGSGELKSGGCNRDSILANALEAIVGAVYIDGGLAPVKDVLDRLYKGLLETLRPADLQDSKTLLQEALQKQNRPLPQYKVINQFGMAHNLTFTVMCCVQGMENGFTATGHSHKSAEQSAAAKALDALTQLWARRDQ